MKHKTPWAGQVPAGIQPGQHCCKMVHHQMGDNGYVRNKFCILKFLSHHPSFTTNACGSISEKMSVTEKPPVIHYSVL